jgi:hypothetical protein
MLIDHWRQERALLNYVRFLLVLHYFLHFLILGVFSE